MPAERTRRGLGLVWLTAVGIAAAQPAPPSAQRLAECAACHGPGGQAAIAQFPSLAGQPRLFIENQLVLIREGLREVPAMQALMHHMEDAEISALARHFEAQKPALPPAAPDRARADAGAALSKKLLCGTCHMPDYRGQNQVPRLAAQNEAFLVLSMKQFRDKPGPGRDTIMASTLRGLSDAELEQLAHHLAHYRSP